MNRRDFLKQLGLGIGVVSLSPLLDLAEIEPAISVAPVLPISLYGIPYHQSNASVGSWLGFSRLDYVKDDLVNLVKIMKENES